MDSQRKGPPKKRSKKHVFGKDTQAPYRPQNEKTKCWPGLDPVVDDGAVAKINQPKWFSFFHLPWILQNHRDDRGRQFGRYGRGRVGRWVCTVIVLLLLPFTPTDRGLFIISRRRRVRGGRGERGDREGVESWARRLSARWGRGWGGRRRGLFLALGFWRSLWDSFLPAPFRKIFAHFAEKIEKSILPQKKMSMLTFSQGSGAFLP